MGIVVYVSKPPESTRARPLRRLKFLRPKWIPGRIFLAHGVALDGEYCLLDCRLGQLAERERDLTALFQRYGYGGTEFR